MTTSRLDSFLADSFTNTQAVTGGCKTPPPADPCPPFTRKEKGNNGLGNGADPAPPGLVKNGKDDFNDGHLS